ncbi:hypothetical protein J2T13_003116 [Paenibacillus sp. DS2015]|uniref:hypothetical protein n=1 Tax=Paenibacillus sp. DS2015 TaxID=3373917 RepID=UPI003D24127C
MSNQSKQPKRKKLNKNKREGVLRIILFIILSSLTYIVQDYAWAVTIITLTALYSLVTGVYRLFRKQS